MSTPDFYSLNQIISWLQQLYERQKKGTSNAAFEIKNYLCYEKIPAYQTLISSDEEMCFYAAKLFSANQNTITLIKKRLVSREHCSEISFEILGESKIIYIKRAWEGAIKEAIGLEFNNLLADTPIRYLCGSEVIMTEKVFEPLPFDTLYELRESAEYIFAYGAWEVFTSLLRLTDRKTTNVRWNGKKLANIDFGLVFYKGKPVFDSRFTVTKKTELRKQGQIYALKHVLASFRQHSKKLEALLVNLDVHFCRTTPCPRTPREPLRVILTALKEIDPEILVAVVLDAQSVKQDKSVNTAFNNHSTVQNNVLIKESVLQSLLNIEGVLYAAIMTNEGVIMDEIQSAKYRAEYELKSQILDHALKYSVLNQQLLELISKGRTNSIVKTADGFKQPESIQIDLTQMRLLIVWSQDKMALVLLEFEVSVAHVKANLRKAMEKFDA